MNDLHLSRRVVLHVGAHKTASTAIQAAAHSHQDDALAVYSRQELESFDCWRNWSEKNWRTFASYLQTTYHATILVSSEDLLGDFPQRYGNVEKLSVIVGALTDAGFSVDIAFVVRAQDDWFRSTWIQLVQSGYRISRDEWRRAALWTSPLAWSELITQIADRGFPAQTHVFRYAPGVVESFFYDMFGLQVQASSEHKSLTECAASLQLAANYILPGARLKQRFRLLLIRWGGRVSCFPGHRLREWNCYLARFWQQDLKRIIALESEGLICWHDTPEVAPRRCLKSHGLQPEPIAETDDQVT